MLNITLKQSNLNSPVKLRKETVSQLIKLNRKCLEILPDHVVVLRFTFYNKHYCWNSLITRQRHFIHHGFILGQAVSVKNAVTCWKQETVLDHMTSVDPIRLSVGSTRGQMEGQKNWEF